ncbi:MAG: aminoacyl-tRNA hydrolase [Oscillospiraceae bacterium]|nr:aminoacyl-tRNA hydrolase [Oscillospiraceae bacterium]
MLKLFKKSNIEWVIVGLGNPGASYENTRHNAGFKSIDYLAKRLDININRLRFKGLTGEGCCESKKVVLLKPQTFMNNSGESIIQVLKYYKLSGEQMIILYDDITLEPGNIKIKGRGSAGGHNGVSDILNYIDNDIFPRIKIGVGKKPYKDMNLADWVLSKFKGCENELMEKSYKKSVDMVFSIVKNGIDKAMNMHN